MHRTLALIASLAAVVCAVAMGCGSSSAAPPACSSNTVSFSKDVMPIFEMSCSLSSSCHALMENPQANLYLGLMAGDGGSADTEAVYKGLLGVVSKEDPSMKLVTAGDTANSFLWHKVNGDQATLNAQCAKAMNQMCVDCNASTPCGGQMPYQSESLSMSAPQSLCALQNWITQGAMNN